MRQLFTIPSIVLFLAGCGSDTPEKNTAAPGQPAAPRTIVVDQGSTGEFKTIAEAINTANPKDTIQIKPGTYRERVVITKTLTVEGTSQRDVIIEIQNQECIYSQAPECTIRKLTLRMLSGDLDAVQIVKGQSIIEDCDVTTAGYSGITARHSNVTVRRCRVHDCKQGGVYFADQATGLVEQCDIASNQKVGVASRGGAKMTAVKNNIHGNKETGVWIYEGGTGTFEENDVYENGGNGFAVLAEGNPTIRKNKIHSNKGCGVEAFEGGIAKFEENDIFENATGVALSKSGANLELRRNRIHHNQNDGVFSNAAAAGTLDDNEICNNGQAGVSIGEKSSLTVRQNKIHHNQQSGIFVTTQASGVLEKNECYQNEFDGIAINADANPQVAGNSVHDNMAAGIYVYGGGRGIIKENEDYDNESVDSIRRNRPASGLTQRLNADQKRWLLACSAPLNERNENRHDLLGTWMRNEQSIEHIKQSLVEQWGIRDRRQLLVQLNSMLKNGHHHEFMDLASQTAGLSSEQFSTLTAQIKDPDALNQLQIVRKYAQKLGSKGIYGWEVVRHINLCRFGYLVGYLTEEESWQNILPVARNAQKVFQSWDELGQNYWIGYQFWSVQNAIETGAKIQQVHQKLLNDPLGPWTRCTWNLDLSVPEK